MPSVSSSDAGGLLLREIDRHTGLIERMDRSVRDPRDPAKVRHRQSELLRQRVFSVALGLRGRQRSLNASPRFDPEGGREPSAGLRGGPRLPAHAVAPGESRRRSALRRHSEALLDAYLAAHTGPRDLIVLDIGTNHDPTHGRQHLSMFHGFIKVLKTHLKADRTSCHAFAANQGDLTCHVAMSKASGSGRLEKRIS